MNREPRIALSSIYEEILKWSRERPEWQRDALRRLAQQGRLGDTDLEELTRFSLAAQGGETLEKKPNPLGAEHLPQQGQAGGGVSLAKLSEVKNVGALLPGQTIEFAPSGLTVIYGDNGSGKSSYARILKRVCRARGSLEAVHGNVFAPPIDPPEAAIDFTIGGRPERTTWKDDGMEAVAPSPLSHVAVFDQNAASAYVSAKQDAAVRPAGLDLLTGLATAADAVRSRIQGRLNAAKGALRPPGGIDAATNAGAFVASLSAKTTAEQIEAATAFPDVDAARAQALAHDLARLDREDPQRFAKELRGRRMRVEALSQRLERIDAALAPRAIEEIEKLRQASAVKEEAASLASALAFGGSLPGVGGEAWRNLWQAARRYSVHAAYPEREFPVVEDGARCVLCQQELTPAAQKRMTSFEEFVTNSAASEAQAARAALNAVRRRIEELAIASADDPVLAQELDEAQPKLGLAVQSALQRAEELRAACIEALEGAKPLPRGEAVTSLPEELRAHATNLEKRAQEALAAHDPAKRRTLERELLELRAREQLSKRRPELMAFVESTRKIAALERCLAETATNSITAKNTELTKRAVTDSLKTYFDEERRGLGLDRTPVELGPAGGARGVLYHQLALRGARAPASPTEILSEGEQRVCALASFLAEMRVAPTASAIIFDDPVSSFDHLRREIVARRLAREATERQVIIFTHDAVFLLALHQAADEWGAPCKIHHVQTFGNSAGHCSEGPPWVGMKVGSRIGFLKSEVTKAEKLFKANERTAYNGFARQLYGLLRESWERAIEEVLLGDVIQRLRLSVETKRLRDVDLLPADYQRIEHGMSKSSAQLVGHDQPAALNTPAPQPDELKADIADLEAWVEEIRQRRKAKK